jgi:hypothetical protein
MEDGLDLLIQSLGGDIPRATDRPVAYDPQQRIAHRRGVHAVPCRVGSTEARADL